MLYMHNLLKATRKLSCYIATGHRTPAVSKYKSSKLLQIILLLQYLRVITHFYTSSASLLMFITSAGENQNKTFNKEFVVCRT